MKSRCIQSAVAFFLSALACGQTIAATPPTTSPSRTVEAHGKTGAYKPMTTRLLADLPGVATPDLPAQTQFGGVTRYPRSKATGFFRTEKIDGRWWLIDPQGCRLINAAVVSTNFGQQSPDVKHVFERKFKSPAGWASATRQFLRDNGFDGTGNWSDDGTLNANADHPLVQSRACSFMGLYAKERGGTHPEPGHLGYPNDCIFVFDPEFPAFADKLARTMAASKDDPYLLGWFTDNELPFKLDALDRYLTLPDKDPGRQAAEAFVSQRHLKRNALTAADREAWTAVLAEKYFGTVHAAIRRYDPNHLILGPRFHATDHRNAALLGVAGKYIDVAGYNLYNVWTPADTVQRISSLSGRPVLITEFYAKADDSGLGNTDGAGWLVRTQADRGAFYENFTLSLIQSRVVVGWQWFKYIDNDPAFAKGKQASDSNKGILDRLYEPYAPLLTSMRRVNAARYAVADYFDRDAAGRR